MTIHRVTIVDGVGIQETKISAYDLGEYARMLFDKTCQEVHNRTNISKKEQHLFEGEAETFACGFEEILKINDKRTRNTALMVTISALSLGYYHAGAPNILQEIKEQFNKEQPKKANAARRRPDVKEIIERRAREQWKLDPSLMNKPYKTASVICSDVIADVNNSPECPQECKVKNQNNPTKGEEMQAINRIRGHLNSGRKP